MSRVHEHEEFDEDDDFIQLTGEESDEVEAAIEYADAHPDEWVEFDEMMRRLRNGE